MRQKISYKAFEEAVHHLFENGMAWVFRKCRALTPSAALLVIVGAVFWIPISFGVATLMHAVLLAKATSLPAWMQLLHPVATIIAKTKLLVLPVYPAAWPRAKQHPSVQAMIRFWHFLTALRFVRKSRYRYRRLERASEEASRSIAASLGLRSLFDLLLGAFDAAASATGKGVRKAAGILVSHLASTPGMGVIVRRYADHYDEANQRPSELLSERMSGVYARWSIKFSAEYYEAKEREEGKSIARA